MKSLNKADVEKLIKRSEEALIEINKHADKPYPQCMSAVGYASGTIESLIKQLKGEYPIF